MKKITFSIFVCLLVSCAAQQPESASNSDKSEEDETATPPRSITGSATETDGLLCQVPCKLTSEDLIKYKISDLTCSVELKDLKKESASCDDVIISAPKLKIESSEPDILFSAVFEGIHTDIPQRNVRLHLTYLYDEKVYKAEIKPTLDY